MRIKIKSAIKAIYKSTKDNEQIKLINDLYKNEIIKEIIDNKDINPPEYEYLFESKGEMKLFFILI